MKKLYDTHFCGNDASIYGKQNNRLDFATFCKAFDMVLNNNIMNISGYDYWELENGMIDNSEEIEEIETKIEEIESRIEELEEIETDESETEIEELKEEVERLENEIEELRTEEDESYYPEVYQTYIISDNGAEMVKEYTDYPLWYNSDLDMYVLGVTHYGTSWSYVLTDIKLNCGKETFESED